MEVCVAISYSAERFLGAVVGAGVITEEQMLKIREETRNAAEQAVSSDFRQALLQLSGTVKENIGSLEELSKE